ncbi:MAG: hypothetical protein IRZ16_02110 [Myxococcaceae bacterium]|nr:hypothetical protein [Myxococcaceae bacterium]
MPPPSSSGSPPSGQAIDAVKLPAIFLIITGAIGLVLALIGIVQHLIGANEAQLAQVMSDPNVPPAAKNFIQMSSKGGVFSNIIVLLTSGFTIFGAMNMMKLRSFGLSMAAAIVAMLPCFGPCCCLGLPIGIWALVVLNKPEVKSAFT